MRQRRIMSSLYPEEVPQPLSWWEVVIGGIAVAVFCFGLVWFFAVLAAVVRGEP